MKTRQSGAAPMPFGAALGFLQKPLRLASYGIFQE
jgi:hypothetical protein